jgi:hypothetical protein
MARGLLIVESRPASPELAAAYHDWYDNKHVPEILQLDGFVSARRLEPLVDGDAFIAIYEIESDVEAARAALQRAQSSGTMSRPEGVQLNPPPIVRYFRQISPVR